MSMENKATTLNPFQRARLKFRDEFAKGIKPVDGRQPIADDLAAVMVAELAAAGVAKDAQIGVVDAFLILSTHLKEAGYTNLTLLENLHKNLSKSQETYYNNVETLCGKSGIQYYIPPMNNYNRCDMQFDVIIGNPPYQSGNGNGDLKGSGTSALWWKFTEVAFKIVKAGGIVSYITPTNILNGSDNFTGLFLGAKRKADLTFADTNVGDSFPGVGTNICRWVAENKVTEGNTATVGDVDIYTDTTFKIFESAEVRSIFNALVNSAAPKFAVATARSADARLVERKLVKDGATKSTAAKLARDWSNTESEEYCFPINSNGKIKYGKVQWETYGEWKLMIPQMKKPFTYEAIVSDVIVPDQSVNTQYFATEEQALEAKKNIDDPRYRWVIEHARVGGRLSAGIIRQLPNAPIEEVLTADQLSFIDSHL